MCGLGQRGDAALRRGNRLNLRLVQHPREAEETPLHCKALTVQDVSANHDTEGDPTSGLDRINAALKRLVPAFTSATTDRNRTRKVDKSILCDKISSRAGVAELADALRSGRSEGSLMWVQIPPSAHATTCPLRQVVCINPRLLGSPGSRQEGTSRHPWHGIISLFKAYSSFNPTRSLKSRVFVSFYANFRIAHGHR